MKSLLSFIVVGLLVISAFRNSQYQARPRDSQANLFVRKNIYSLAQNDPILVSFRQGVSAMKNRPANDPTSWAFQAAIHGTIMGAMKPGWDSCQHGTFFFLSWHRMYLYYFERILRKYSQNPAFALPYWNYSDNRAWAALPVMFRQPANAENVFFVAQRDPGINQGGPIAPEFVAYQQTFDDDDQFSSSSTSNPGFGGLRVPQPMQMTPHGPFEQQPHDQVHGAIDGWMNNPLTAAQDPVFFVHHAFIDRLWEKWRRISPDRDDQLTNSPWMKFQFTFYDENGQMVKMSGQQVLNTAQQLNYVYDDLGPAPAQEPGFAPRGVDTIPLSVSDFFRVGAVKTAGSQTEVGLENIAPQNVHGFAKMRMRDVVDTGRHHTDKVIMTLKDIVVDSNLTGLFEVFVNLPAGQKPSYESVSYAGNISPFGLSGHHHGSMEGGTVLLNITKTYRALLADHVELDQIKLTLLHRGATVGGEAIFKGEIRIGSITISTVTQER